MMKPDLIQFLKYTANVNTDGMSKVDHQQPANNTIKLLTVPPHSWRLVHFYVLCFHALLPILNSTPSWTSR